MLVLDAIVAELQERGCEIRRRSNNSHEIWKATGHFNLVLSNCKLIIFYTGGDRGYQHATTISLTEPDFFERLLETLNGFSGAPGSF